jgi:hypothetical protein
MERKISTLKGSEKAPIKDEAWIASEVYTEKAAVPALIVGWAGLLAAGFGILMRYESAAAPAGSTGEINATFNGRKGLSIVVGLHPHCPCSKATVAELNKILGRAPNRAEFVVYAFKPKDEPDNWIESSTIETLKKLGGRIEVDEDGAKARELGLKTSGQVQLFSASGELLYNGGITAGRGHQGDNAGAKTMVDLLQKGGSDRKSAPVFGCPIFETSSP